jgi:hypothetical protein
LTATAKRNSRNRTRGGPGAGRHRRRLRTEICCLSCKEKIMNQVAVVIGGDKP